jgi:hypothetical protein
MTSTCGYNKEPKPILLNGKSRAPKIIGAHVLDLFTPCWRDARSINKEPAIARTVCWSPRYIMKFKGALTKSLKNCEINRGVSNMWVSNNDVPAELPIAGGWLPKFCEASV